MQLLRDVVPNAKILGLIVNPDNLARTSSTGRDSLELVQEAVRGWGVTVEVAHARSVRDLKSAVASLKEKRVDAAVTSSDSLFFSGRNELVALAAQHAVPTIFHSADIVQIGGLIGYSASIIDSHRQAGLYVGRVLKGEKPGDLPVLLPTKFELAINLKTAKALGLTITRELLLAADEVIE